MSLAPGIYEIECFISHHDERGMRGMLEVRADAPLVARPAAPTPTAVTIAGFAFKPATLKTTVGKTVTWRNADAAPHTATATAFSSPQLGKGGSFRRRSAVPGRTPTSARSIPECGGRSSSQPGRANELHVDPVSPGSGCATIRAMRRYLAWPLALPLAVIGTLSGHSLGYWAAVPDAHAREDVLAASGHGYFQSRRSSSD